MAGGVLARVKSSTTCCVFLLPASKAGPGSNSAHVLRPSTTRPSKSFNTSRGMTKSRWPAACWPPPAAYGPVTSWRSRAQTARIICWPFQVGQISRKPSPTGSSTAAMARCHSKARQQRRRTLFRYRLFQDRRTFGRRCRTDRDPRRSRRPASQIVARSAEASDRSGARAADGAGASRTHGRDQAELKDIASAAQENTRNFGRAEALVKLLNEKLGLHDDAIVKFAEGQEIR
jgi:hypothetical protein